jgi:cysteine/glycine-rich protein
MPSIPVSNARSMFESRAAAPVVPPRLPPKTNATASRFGASPKCAKCGKSAYANESCNAIGQTWHKTCFACSACNKGMGSDVGNACDNDGLPYCKSCHAKNFGPKGIGFGNTMGDTGVQR